MVYTRNKRLKKKKTNTKKVMRGGGTKEDNIEKMRQITTQWYKFSYPGQKEGLIPFDKLVEDTRRWHEGILLKLLNRGWAFIIDKDGNMVDNPENKDSKIVEAWNINFNKQFIPEKSKFKNPFSKKKDEEIPVSSDITEIKQTISNKKAVTASAPPVIGLEPPITGPNSEVSSESHSSPTLEPSLEPSTESNSIPSISTPSSTESNSIPSISTPSSAELSSTSNPLNDPNTREALIGQINNDPSPIKKVNPSGVKISEILYWIAIIITSPIWGSIGSVGLMLFAFSGGGDNDKKHWITEWVPTPDTKNFLVIKGKSVKINSLFEIFKIWKKSMFSGIFTKNISDAVSVPLFTNLRSDFYKNKGYQIVIWPTYRNYDLDTMVGTDLAMRSLLESLGMPKESDNSNLLSNEPKPLLSALKAVSFFPNLLESTPKERREYSGTDYMADISTLIKNNKSLQEPKEGSQYLPDLFIKTYSDQMPNFIFRRYKKGQVLPPYEGQKPHLVISDRTHFFNY